MVYMSELLIVGCGGLGRMFLPRFFRPFQCPLLGLLFLQLLFQRAPNGFR